MLFSCVNILGRLKALRGNQVGVGLTYIALSTPGFKAACVSAAMGPPGWREALQAVTPHGLQKGLGKARH